MSAPRPVFAPVLLTSESELPSHPETRALLFLECVSQGIIAWEALLEFHRCYRARPVDWPRSFVESFSMMRLAVVMTAAYGECELCPEVTRTLAHHLFDRDVLHPELAAILRNAIPQGVAILITPSSSRPTS